MTLIQQRNAHDCGVAAFAMFLNIPYEESLELMSTTTYATNTDEETGETTEYFVFTEGYGTVFEYNVLKRLGWKVAKFYGEDWHKSDWDAVEMHIPAYIDSKLFAKLLWGREALVSVKSMNVEGGYHYIYYDGSRVWDPNEGNEGKKYSTILTDYEITEFIIKHRNKQ